MIRCVLPGDYVLSFPGVVCGRNESGYDSAGNYLENHHDENGNCIYIKQILAIGDTIEETYDANGVKTSCLTKFANGEEIEERSDENGNRIMERTTQASGVESKTMYRADGTQLGQT